MAKKQMKTARHILLCFFMMLCLNTCLFGQDDVSATAAPPLAPTAPAQPSLCINGIIFGGKNSLAVINGDSFKQGDIVEGARIVAITESAVTFEFNGSTFSESLGEGCGMAKTTTKAIEKTIEEATRQIQSNITLPSPKTVSPQLKFDSRAMKAGMATVGLFLFFILLGYVYQALTLQLVAKKTGIAASWLAWIPVANIFLMCMIAHRPLWWAVLVLILPFTIIGILPVFIMIVVMLMDIAAACSKPKWLAFLIFVPFGLLFFWGYLAFSKMTEPAETPIERIPETRPESPKPEIAKAAEPSQAATPTVKPADNKPVDDKQVSKQPDSTTQKEPPIKEPPVYNG